MCCADVCSDVRVCANQCVHNAAYLSECERAFVLAVLDGWRVSTCWPRSEGSDSTKSRVFKETGLKGSRRATSTAQHTRGCTLLSVLVAFFCRAAVGIETDHKDEERS